MANSPDHMWVNGVRVRIRYVRPFKQTVPVERCWASRARIEHSCEEMGCWGDIDWLDGYRPHS